ncbi:helix-turn-helix domain-containing protein [Lentisphaerota bacterium ZTH]|nr:helix-turn-helix domain containing protein [Lentisphaerota bacterium]WET05785.1 helix-turn-helix domain-containing protein [Lentisphaerota bacterium ZTH]
MSYLKTIKEISPGDIKKLKMMARSNTIENRYSVRAAIILMSIRESSYSEICHSLNVSRHTVSKWRKRFLAGGIDGLNDASGRGRPPKYTTMDKAQILELAYSSTKNNKHLPQRFIARQLGMSQTTVNRVMSRKNSSDDEKLWNGSPYELEFQPKRQEIKGLLLTPHIKLLGISSTIAEPVSADSKNSESEAQFHRQEALLAALSLRAFNSCNISQSLYSYLRKLAVSSKGADIMLLCHTVTHRDNLNIDRWLSRHHHIEMSSTPDYRSWTFAVKSFLKIMAKETADFSFWNNKDAFCLEIMQKIEEIAAYEQYFFSWLG